MKRNYAVAFVMLMSAMLLTGCTEEKKGPVDAAEEKEETENTVREQTSEKEADMEAEKQGTAEGNPSQITYPGERYTWNEITVTIPEDWADRYMVLEDENGFAFYQEASYDKMEGMGYLCSFTKSDAWMNYGTGETLLAYTDDGTMYYRMCPTDVTGYMEDDAIFAEYCAMSGEVDMLAASIGIDAMDVHYDADQYVIPISSILPVTEETLVNMSENELWIARNEIYARHGRIFKNEYLQNYFESCSWYQAIEGKSEVADEELSQTERANLDRIIEMEQIDAEEHPYPVEYQTGTKGSEDLTGQGTQNTFGYTVTGEDENAQYLLTIDGIKYDLGEYITMASPVRDVFYVTDISESFGVPEFEDGLEIAVLDEGPSSDPVTHFFKYDGELKYLGEVSGFPFREQSNGICGFNHQSGVTGTVRMDLIETTYLDGYWWYDSNAQKLEYMETGRHAYKWRKAHELYCDLPVYFSENEASPVITIKAGQPVYFLESDLKEWILVRAKDGTSGYVHVKDEKVLNVGTPAEEVFSDLYYAD